MRLTVPKWGFSGQPITMIRLDIVFTGHIVTFMCILSRLRCIKCDTTTMIGHVYQALYGAVYLYFNKT